MSAFFLTQMTDMHLRPEEFVQEDNLRYIVQFMLFLLMNTLIYLSYVYRLAFVIYLI